jgi:predicted ATP-dependent endonuclease of OLD family
MVVAFLVKLSSTMQLIAAHFDAFRSLLGKSIDLSQKCIGLVGINESGKSNVLRALSSLGADRPLVLSDAPKMARRTPPSVRFELALEPNEREKVKQQLEAWAQQADVPAHRINVANCKVIFHVEFDKAADRERRFFTIEGIEVKDAVFLRREALTESYFVALNNEMVPLSDLVILTPAMIAHDDQIQQQLLERDILRSQLEDLNSTIEDYDERISALKETDDDPEDVADEDSADVEKDATAETAESESIPQKVKTKKKAAAPSNATNQRAIELLELQGLRAAVETHRDLLLGDMKTQNEALGPYTERASELADLEDEAKLSKNTLTTLPAVISEAQTKVSALEALAAITAEQKTQLQSERQRLTKSQNQLNKLNREVPRMERGISALQVPLSEKYTSDASALAYHAANALKKDLNSWLPKVVTWQYSPDFILESETEFENVRSVASLGEISRPLVNLFRIGLNVGTIEELKERIDEIQTDPSERSRCQDDLNINIQHYLTSVWPSYDQSIRITLEQERIRVQFVDPNRKGASYYSMEERSQGCQTFISFLLTIGAEASRGVISDTLLLLDEPETHLHPSGVRFMLNELVKAASNGNIVVFATHSIFMIDTTNYDRHMIVAKKDEQTVISPSRKERIGYFMQEEVLYSALDVDLAKVGAPRRHFNFVFEGDGDAKLFECYYDRILKDAARPFDKDKTEFYHGGKCSDILQCFKRRPAQMGSHWIFILDKDKPAEPLVNFLEHTYREFIGTYIHICQYGRPDVSHKEIELEDLLPPALIQKAITKASEALGIITPLTYGDGTESYGESIARVLAQVDQKERFQAAMKESLNEAIADTVANIKSKGDFEKAFPHYLTWVTATCESLKEKSKPMPSAMKVERPAPA